MPKCMCVSEIEIYSLVVSCTPCEQQNQAADYTLKNDSREFLSHGAAPKVLLACSDRVVARRQVPLYF
jgi:hypothetical protein